MGNKTLEGVDSDGQREMQILIALLECAGLEGSVGEVAASSSSNDLANSRHSKRKHTSPALSLETAESGSIMPEAV